MKLWDRGSGRRIVLFLYGLVVFLLASIFWPVSTPPEVARKSNCQANLKECAVALQAYCSDYDGHLPSSAIVRHAGHWSESDFREFATISGARPAKGRPITWSQVLYNSMRNKDIVFCPSDVSDTNDPQGRLSYYWRAALDKAWYGLECKHPRRKTSDFSYPASQIVFYERAAYHEREPRGLVDHRKINVVLLDAHVRNVSLVNCGTRFVTDPAASGEPRYFNYDNKAPEGKAELPAGVRATYVDPNRYSDKLP